MITTSVRHFHFDTLGNDISIASAYVSLSCAATVDEHFQRVGAEAFHKFQGSAPH
jgi:hypothetical protein